MLGTDVPWVATPGWDFTAGLGTFWVSELYDALVP